MRNKLNNLTRLKSFREYCQKNDIDVMYDDLCFIDKCLNSFRKNDFKAILEVYIQKWCEGMELHPNASLSSGNGRRFANLWLLEHTNEQRNKKNENMVF